MENIKNDKQSLPTYNELVEALKDTHNLYIEAIRDKYMTHDMTRVMENNIIFNRLKYRETIKIDENHNNIQNQSIENVEVKCDCSSVQSGTISKKMYRQYLRAKL